MIHKILQNAIETFSVCVPAELLKVAELHLPRRLLSILRYKLVRKADTFFLYAKRYESLP
jgi:hypothetical protein